MDIKPVLDAASDTHIKNKGVCETLSEVHPAALVRTLAAEVVVLRSALLQAKEEGRREGMREAAEICNDNPYLNGVDCAEIITRAAEGK